MKNVKPRWNLHKAFRRVRISGWYPENTYFARPHIFWHRQGLADTAAGSPGKLTFFNANKATGITNLPTAGRIATNHIFSLEKVGIFISQGVDVAGNNEALQAVYAEGATLPATSPGLAAEAIRKLYEHGNVRATIGNRVVIDDIYGCMNFPWGSSARLNAGHTFDDATNAVASQFAQVSTGSGSTQDGYWFENAVPIYPDRNFELTIDWSNVSFDTYADLVVQVGMFGRMVTVTGL